MQASKGYLKDITYEDNSQKGKELCKWGNETFQKRI